MKWCRVLIFLSYVHLTRSSKISRQGKNRRHGCYKRQGTAVEWMSPWSDWKVRQGRAYSVTLPPACGRRQGYRIMPCPFGLSSHSRRHNQSSLRCGASRPGEWSDLQIKLKTRLWGQRPTPRLWQVLLSATWRPAESDWPQVCIWSFLVVETAICDVTTAIVKVSLFN